MRLIDGSALLKELRKVQKECEKDGEEMGGESVLIAVGLDDACDIVKLAKTVDAQPVVHGRWMRNKKNRDIYCSQCKIFMPMMPETDLHGERKTFWLCDFCPNCGADMRSGKGCLFEGQ